MTEKYPIKPENNIAAFFEVLVYIYATQIAQTNILFCQLEKRGANRDEIIKLFEKDVADQAANLKRQLYADYGNFDLDDLLKK